MCMEILTRKPSWGVRSKIERFKTPPPHLPISTSNADILCEQLPHTVCHSNGWICWMSMSMSWCNNNCVFFWWDQYWYIPVGGFLAQGDPGPCRSLKRQYDTYDWYSFQTGTLTEGDLDLAGVCEIRENQFQVKFWYKFQMLSSTPAGVKLFTATHPLIQSPWQCKLIERGEGGALAQI